MIPVIYKISKVEGAVTEMYLWIPWKLVADNLGSSEHTLGSTELKSIHVPVPS
jgi:hypothetical protein